MIDGYVNTEARVESGVVAIIRRIIYHQQIQTSLSIGNAPYCYESCVIGVLARQTDGSTDTNYNEGLAYIAAEPHT